MKKNVFILAMLLPLISQAQSSSCPDDHHPHMIDLGLPSGTLWACCNVGADSPEGYGGYYAWGETVTKDSYTAANYTYYNTTTKEYKFIGKDISGTQYDVAFVKWGSPWRMPTHKQYQELYDNCTSTWTTQNGVNGLKFTGPNGGTIFLPTAGFRRDTGLYGRGSDGSYWSSELFSDNSSDAWTLYFSDGHAGADYGSLRYFGRSVRPVLVQ